MYIYLDESGDWGLRENSSSHFVITILVCHDKASLLAIRTAVKKTLTTKCRKKDRSFSKELKGSETTLAIKKYFYSQLLRRSNNNWEIYSIVVDKALLAQITHAVEPHRIYNILSREIISRIDFSSLTSNVELFVDKCKGRYQRTIFDQFLKAHIEPALPLNFSINIEHKLSHNIAGLQAVDLFCHGIARKHALQDTDWYTTFANKITDEINWKPKVR